MSKRLQRFFPVWVAVEVVYADSGQGTILRARSLSKQVFERGGYLDKESERRGLQTPRTCVRNS